MIEDKSIHVLDSSIYYKEIIEFLDSSTEDIDNFMSGKTLLSFCNSQSLEKNIIFKALIQPTEYDHVLTAILKVILPGISKLFKRIFVDYLDDGIWGKSRSDEKLRQFN